MRREEQSASKLSDVFKHIWYQRTVSLCHIDSETCPCTVPHRLRLVFPSCSCFPLKIHLQSKGKTFQVVVAEYRSNLEGCKWLHCEALKGRREQRGLRRLMTLAHWGLEVSKRREEVWCSILLEVEQTFHCRMSGLCCELSWLLLNQGSDSSRDKQTLLPRHPSGGGGATLTQCTTLLIKTAGLLWC